MLRYFPLALAAFSTAALAAATPADQAYLERTARGAKYELALAQAASTGATGGDVRAYARKIIRDHGQANPALAQLLRAEGVSPPGGMDASDAAKLARLKGLRGAAFDKAYVDEVTRINAEDERDSAKEQRATKDTRIKAYLQRFSRMDAEHKRLGEQLKRG